MSIPAITPTENLPTLIDRAARSLTNARTSGEVLEARDMARTAYDVAKSAARLVKAKTAHDTILAQIYEAQGHALAIRARAEVRLAEEYDAALERGEVRTQRDNQLYTKGKKLSSADLGLGIKDIHEARQIAAAEDADPGIVQRTIDKLVEAGE